MIGPTKVQRRELPPRDNRDGARSAAAAALTSYEKEFIRVPSGHPERTAADSRERNSNMDKLRIVLWPATVPDQRSSIPPAERFKRAACHRTPGSEALTDAWLWFLEDNVAQ